MDDTKTPSQNPVNQNQDDTEVFSQNPVAGTTHMGSKEAEPIGISNSREHIRPTEHSIELDKEVKEAGVEAVSEEKQLTLEDKKAGLELAKESTPVPTQPTQTIKLPMSPQEAIQTAKSNDVGSAKVWLANLVEKVLKMSKANK